MEQLCLSVSILALKRTAAEKILLACICQRAAVNGGQCIDTNKELGKAVAMHPQTVSDLVNKLSDILRMTIRADNLVTGQRILTPSSDLMIAYQVEVSSSEPPLSQSLTPSLSQLLTPPKSITDRVGGGCSPYPSITDRPAPDHQRKPKREQRLCPMTSVDITHQRPNCRYASKLTLEKLQRKQPEVFSQLAERFLLPGERPHPYTLAERIRKLARIEVAVERTRPRLD